MNKQSIVRTIGFSLIMISISSAGVGAMAGVTDHLELPPEVTNPPPGIMEMEAFGALARDTMFTLAWYGVAAAFMAAGILFLIRFDKADKEAVAQ